jgi:hypothetical protein
MTELGPNVRDADLLGYAETVTAETMSRVRTNVELLVERLAAAGYELERPEEAHVPPRAALAEQIDELETRVGDLPLSLRGFYEVVGTVDLTQSSGQLVQWHLPERSAGLRAPAPGGIQPARRRGARPRRRHAGMVLLRPRRASQGELQRRRELPRRAPGSRSGLSDSGAVRRRRGRRVLRLVPSGDVRGRRLSRQCWRRRGAQLDHLARSRADADAGRRAPADLVWV